MGVAPALVKQAFKKVDNNMWSVNQNGQQKCWTTCQKFSLEQSPIHVTFSSENKYSSPAYLKNMFSLPFANSIGEGANLSCVKRVGTLLRHWQCIAPSVISLTQAVWRHYTKWFSSVKYPPFCLLLHFYFYILSWSHILKLHKKNFKT